jgi:hypothetical protein
MLDLAEKLALPFLGLFWAGAIIVMSWIILRPAPIAMRSNTAETRAPELAKTRLPRGPLTASEKRVSRRRPLVR